MSITTGNEDGDAVNHPAHYNSHPSGIEAIEVVRHFGFNVGNTIKYLWRAGLKTDLTKDEIAAELEDVEKALWYLEDHRLTLVLRREKMAEDEADATRLHPFRPAPTGQTVYCSLCSEPRQAIIHQTQEDQK